MRLFRKGDPKLSAVTGHRDRLYAAAMLLDDAPGDRETKAGPQLLLFRRKERLEDLRQDFRSNTRTVVADHQADMFRVGSFEPKLDMSALARSLRGIRKQYENDLLDLSGVTHDRQ